MLYTEHNRHIPLYDIIRYCKIVVITMYSRIYDAILKVIR